MIKLASGITLENHEAVMLRCVLNESLIDIHIDISKTLNDEKRSPEEIEVELLYHRTRAETISNIRHKLFSTHVRVDG